MHMRMMMQYMAMVWEEQISNLVGRCRFEWQGANCDFVNDGEVFIAKGRVVVICDP